MLTMESFCDLQARHRAEAEAFPKAFAFSAQQFAEGLRHLGLDPERDAGEVTGIGAGGFVRRADLPAWNALAERQWQELADWREECLRDPRHRPLLVAAIRDELANHEYGYTRDWAQVEEALNVLGLSLEDAGDDARLTACVEEARAQCVRDYEEWERREDGAREAEA